MDQFHKITGHLPGIPGLPSSLAQRIPGFRHERLPTEDMDAKGYRVQFPPPEWSQSSYTSTTTTSTPATTPGAAGAGAAWSQPGQHPSAPLYNNNNNNYGYANPNDPQAGYPPTFKDPIPTPGSGGFAIPAAPVARPERWVSYISYSINIYWETSKFK